MAHDPLSDIIASVRGRLQQELEAQLRAIAEHHEQALAEARRQIEAEAEERWSALLNAARAETEERVETTVSAARAELERESAAEVARVRAEAEQRAAAEVERIRGEQREQLRSELERVRAEGERHAADAVTRVRRELEQALAAERQLGQARLDAERRSAAEQLELAREAFDTERLAGHGRQEPRAVSLLENLREIDAARSISDTLATLVRAAAGGAGRAALFVANGAQLDEWTAAGVPSIGVAHHEGGIAALLEQALQTGAVARGTDGACAAPLLLDSIPVGVLYGTPTREQGHSDSDEEWAAALEVLARHGAAHLAYLTAVRTAQARQWLSSTASPAAVTEAPSPTPDDQEAAARRYARLLVSEIKMYNDAAVRTGRQQRDLLQRLGAEIERARRAYEERVPAHVAGRAHHFHDELVQTLAGGDPSLLN